MPTEPASNDIILSQWDTLLQMGYISVPRVFNAMYTDCLQAHATWSLVFTLWDSPPPSRLSSPAQLPILDGYAMGYRMPVLPEALVTAEAQVCQKPPAQGPKAEVWVEGPLLPTWIRLRSYIPQNWISWIWSNFTIISRLEILDSPLLFCFQLSSNLPLLYTEHLVFWLCDCHNAWQSF